jgi:hypothetical protein
MQQQAMLVPNGIDVATLHPVIVGLTACRSLQFETSIVAPTIVSSVKHPGVHVLPYALQMFAHVRGLPLLESPHPRAAIWQACAWQMSGSTHVLHTAPPAPHALLTRPVTHCPPLQQPLGHD